MGRRRQDDPIDQLCRSWGRERRKTLGLDELDFERNGIKCYGVGAPASEYLGAIRSTLGQRRDLPAFSSSGKIQQQFPEVYTGEVLLVHRAYRVMPFDLRRVMDAHYVAYAPPADKAAMLCMSLKRYFEAVNQARRYVEGWINAHYPADEVG